MANKEQVKILKQGVEGWNSWREENPDAKIDLRGAKLDGRDLSGANFRQADIRGASFKDTMLCKADMKESVAGVAFSWRIPSISPACSLFFWGTSSLFKIFSIGWCSFWLFVLLDYIDCLEDNILSFPLISISIFIFFIIPFDERYKQSTKTTVCMFSLLYSVFFSLIILSQKHDDAYTFSKILIYSFPFFMHVNILSSFDHGLSFSDTVIDIFTTLFASLIFYFAVLFIFEHYSIIGRVKSDIFIQTWIFFAISYLLIGLYIGFIMRNNHHFNPLRKIMLFAFTRFGTDFRQADLTGASFDNACLENAQFGGAVLINTSFQNVQKLHSAACDDTILDDRDVRNLLVHGKGKCLTFKGKDLSGAYLAGADLRHADFRGTNLMQANLSRADITGAKLYGSTRENWIIDGICCHYVYWDETREKRSPPKGAFYQGGFEKLHKQSPTFNYVFDQGVHLLDLLIMDRVVQEINEEYSEFSLDLISFDKRDQPYVIFTASHLNYVERAKEEIAKRYKATKGQPKILRLIQDSLLSGELTMGDTYNIQGGQVGAVGKKAIATGNIFQQITPELSRLHEEMQSKAATPEQQAATQDVAKAEQAAQQGDESTMQQHLKNAGQWTLDCAQKVGTDVLTEYLKKLTTGM